MPEPVTLSPAWVWRHIRDQATNGRFGHLVISERLPESGHLRRIYCGCLRERIFFEFLQLSEVLKARKTNLRSDGTGLVIVLDFATDIYHIISILGF